MLLDAADGANLLIAEAYRMDKNVPYHLRHADLAAHRHRLTSQRVVLTHLGAEVIGRAGELDFEAAHDGLTIDL